MATFEEAGICDQILSNSFGLVRNMRDNANGYKAQITAGKTAAYVAAIMVQDADQYLIRMQWMTDLATRNLSMFDAALATRNLTRAAANTLKATLKSVADHTKAATLTTNTQVNAEADYILANVPNYERIY